MRWLGRSAVLGLAMTLLAALIAVPAATASLDTTPGIAWGSHQAPLPANAAADPGLILGEASCPAAGSCAAVGDYTDTAGRAEGVGEVLGANGWSGTELPVPANAGADPTVDLSALSCQAAGSCLAVGTFVTGAGQTRGFAETLAAGSWTTAALPLPANSFGDVTFTSVACPAPSTCVAVGSYNDGDAFIDTLSAGTWTTVEAPLPSDGTHGAGDELTDVACPAAGACVSVGWYQTPLAPGKRSSKA